MRKRPKDNDTPNNSMNMRAKQRLCYRVSFELGVAWWRFRPTSSQALVVIPIPTTAPMTTFAKQQGKFKPDMFQPFDKLQIVTIQQILDGEWNEPAADGGGNQESPKDKEGRPTEPHF